MNLVIIAAVIAVAGAAKLDRTYLPPPSAATAGGSPGFLQAPLTRSSEQGLETPRLPTGSYTNNFQGVVVDAAAPGTRASADTDLSGLGGPRPSYGSTDSKVGDAAFRGSVAGFRDAPIRSASSLEHPGQITHHSGGYSINGQGNSAQSLQGFPLNGASSEENRPERPQAAKDRNSNILNFTNDVSSDVYSYGFETDNGITVGENGVAVNGVQAEGGYSYQGDDGQVYKITYTAGEGGYRPQGNHLPTPPPIPEEILKSLEKNAEEEAAGHVDDGSYDAQKYNTDSDYTHDNGGNNQYNRPQPSQFGKRPESDATASGMINQNSQAFGNPGNFGSGNHNTHSAINGQSSHGNFGSAPFRPGSIGQNSHSNFNEQSQGNGDSGSAHFGAGSNGQNSQFAINGQSQGNGDSGSANFGPGSNGQNSHSAFNGQSQGNRDSGSAHFGVGSNGQNSHSAFNGQSQGNGDSGSAHFGPGSNGQNSQLAFNGQSNQGNQYNSNFGSTQNGEDKSQNIQHSYSSQQNEPQTGLNSGNGVTLGQSGNKSPSGSQYHQQEFNSQPTKPATGQNAGTLGLNAGSQIQLGGQTLNAQNQGFNVFTGASNYHQEMPSKYNKHSQSQFSSSESGAQSIPTGNYNKPIEGKVQVNQFGSSTNYNRLPQTQNQFGANNEYLPPQSSLSPGPNSNFVNSGSSLSEFNSNLDQKAEKIEKNPSSFISYGQTPGFSSASASASFGQPALRPSAAHTVPDVISKPTAVPDTELTTPLEPNEIPSTTNSQFSSQSTNSGSLGSNSINQQPQTQFGFQGNSADKQSSQTLSPSFPTSSSQFSSNSQFGTAPIQSTFPVSSGKEPGSNNKPQITHNSFGNKPSYNQVSELPQQYNQPSKPFDKPSVHPQGSRFPSSSFNQPNGVASQNLLFNQQNHFQSSSQPSGSPSFASVAPTSATQFTQTHGSTSSNYNGITQAAISPFPSAAPTSVSQFGTAENGQLGSKPTFNQQSAFSNPFQSASNQQNKPEFSQQSGQQSFLSSPVAQFGQKPTQPQQFGQSESSGLSHGSPQEQTSVTQQNSGTIYQYNKPAVAQAPQFGQKPTLLGQSETTPQSLIGLSQQQTSGTQQNGGTIYQYNRPAEVHTPQFEQKPTQFGQSNTKLESSDGSTQQQTTVTQQYEGTIYQYNKPAEVLPSPTPDSSSSQTIQTGITSASKPIFGQFQENQLPTQQNIKPQFGSQTQSLSQNSFSTHQQTDFTQGSLGPQTNKPFGSAPSTAQYGQHSSSGHDSFQSQHNTGSQFGALPSFKPQSGQITQSALESSSSTQLNHKGAQSSPFGAASQGAQSTFGSKPQFSSPSQLTQTTNFVGSSQTSQPGRGSGSQSQFNTQAIGNGASSQDNGYVYPKNPQPQFGESNKNQFGQNPAFGSSQSANSQLSGSFNQQPYQTQFSSKPAFGNPSQTQFGQNAQTTHGQKTPNSLIKPFDQLQFGQASSQAIASGQASASAFASNSPQAKPFSQSNQSQGSQQIGAQNSKPFNSNGQGASGSKPYGALNLSQFGVNESTDISNPLFESPCCQGSKDSAPSQSTVRPSISGQEDQASFQGAQNFNAQSFAGKGEEFGGPRPPPRFDDNTGYHY